MYKENKVVILSNDANVVLVSGRNGSSSFVLCSKICKGGLKNFGLDMVQKIHYMYEQLATDFYSSLLNAHILTGYGKKIKVVPKQYNKCSAALIWGIAYFL